MAREGGKEVNTGPIQRTVIHDPPLTWKDVEGYDDPVDLPDAPPPDWVTWERRYGETKDADEAIRYAVLAIGRLPNNPPAWAVEACVSYFQEHERAAKSRRPAEDGELLDWAAELWAGWKVGSDKILAKGKGVNAALRAVVAVSRGVDMAEVDHNDSEVRRLRKLWDGELKVSPLVDPDTGKRIHPRFERAAVRIAKRKGCILKF